MKTGARSASLAAMLVVAVGACLLQTARAADTDKMLAYILQSKGYSLKEEGHGCRKQLGWKVS